jgi:hypothetical protein
MLADFAHPAHIVDSRARQFYATRQKLSLVGDRKPLADDTLLKDAD